MGGEEYKEGKGQFSFNLTRTNLHFSEGNFRFDNYYTIFFYKYDESKLHRREMGLKSETSNYLISISNVCRIVVLVTEPVIKRPVSLNEQSLFAVILLNILNEMTHTFYFCLNLWLQDYFFVLTFSSIEQKFTSS